MHHLDIEIRTLSKSIVQHFRKGHSTEVAYEPGETLKSSAISPAPGNRKRKKNEVVGTTAFVKSELIMRFPATLLWRVRHFYQTPASKSVIRSPCLLVNPTNPITIRNKHVQHRRLRNCIMSLIAGNDTLLRPAGVDLASA